VLGTPADPGLITARGAEPVDDGAPWTEGAEGSDITRTVLVRLLDEPATAVPNGGQAHVTVRFDATSTEDPE
jgi:hypothetical protein